MISRLPCLAGAAALAALLAGCGGGAIRTLPPDGGSARSAQFIPPTTPVLYVASNDRIEAFDLTASGSAPPNRTIFVHPNQVDANVAITAFIDGTLDVLQNWFPASGPIPQCRIVVETSTANGSATALSPNTSCGGGGPEQAMGIATNAINSQLDVLFECGCGDIVLGRFSQSFGSGVLTAPVSSLTVELSPPVYLAIDRGGHDWFNDANGGVFRLRHDQNDASCGGECFPVASFATGTSSAGLAVSPVDLTVYVIEPGGGNGGADRIAGYAASAWQPCTGSPPCYLSPSEFYDFAGGAHPTALAVDRSGAVYAGVTTVNGARVKVFPANLSAPTRNLTALPGDGATKVTALAIYQP